MGTPKMSRLAHQIMGGQVGGGAESGQPVALRAQAGFPSERLKVYKSGSLQASSAEH